jgi:hypothetical protein
MRERQDVYTHPLGRFRGKITTVAEQLSQATWRDDARYADSCTATPLQVPV